MSTFRAVPRYPQMVIPTTQDYAAWLADGQKCASGVIDIVDGRDTAGYIQPDEFPDERIYFSFKDWPWHKRRDGMVGKQVKFDLPPTEYDPRLKAMAFNVEII